MAELEIDAVMDNLQQVFDFVTGELSTRTNDKKLIRKIKLCVEEIFTNISSYAYHPSTGSAKIMVRVEGNPVPIRVFLTFIDNGQPFDPLSEEAPDTEAELEDRNPGGLGIFLVKNNVDGISYEYSEGQNILTIEKVLPMAAEGGR